MARKKRTLSPFKLQVVSVNYVYVAQDQFVHKWVSSNENAEDKTEKRLAEEINEHVDAIRDTFHTMFSGESSTKPNSFTVKLDVINEARSYWLRDFARIYDSEAFLNGDVMDGVCYLSVHSDGISLLSDNQLLLEDFNYTQILQISQER